MIFDPPPRSYANLMDSALIQRLLPALLAVRRQQRVPVADATPENGYGNVGVDYGASGPISPDGSSLDQIPLFPGRQFTPYPRQGGVFNPAALGVILQGARQARVPTGIAAAAQTIRQGQPVPVGIAQAGAGIVRRKAPPAGVNQGRGVYRDSQGRLTYKGTGPVKANLIKSAAKIGGRPQPDPRILAAMRRGGFQLY